MVNTRYQFYNPLAWMMAIAIDSTAMTACRLDSYEPEKPFTTCPPSPKATLYACGISQSETRTASDAQNVLFTEDEIEWFIATTREIKFFDKQSGKAERKDMDEPLYRRLEPFHEIEFYLGDDALFVVSSFVGDCDSRIFTDLVLHYDVITDPNQGHYFLHDCYPLLFADTDEVKANREKNAAQWETFTKYLESKGKFNRLAAWLAQEIVTFSVQSFSFNYSPFSPLKMQKAGEDATFSIKKQYLCSDKN